MWVFTTIGFFSIVAHRDRRDCLLVRARDKADLTALVRLLPLPRPKVQRTPHADYLFRAVVKKDAMARVLASLTEGIDYDNFKDEVAKVQGVQRAKVYGNVWHALLPLQPPKLALVKPRPKHKYSPHGGIVFGEISGAENDAIERAKAERVAREKRAERPEFNPDDYSSEAEMLAALRARLGPAYDRMSGRGDNPFVFTSDKTAETDAGMLPGPDERPEFNSDDYATEDEARAALRARMGEAQFRRFDDQSDGKDICCFDENGKEI